MENRLLQPGSLHKALGKISQGETSFSLKVLAEVEKSIHWTVQFKCRATQNSC